jgi:hypothetical protein
MYIGSKSRKYDSVNQNMNRVWAGTGTICDIIPPTQAANLVAHKDEFIDVSSFTPEDLQIRAQQAISDAKEKLRNARALGAAKKSGASSALLLEFATDEQLAEEVQRRQQRATLASQVIKSSSEPTPAEKNLRQLTDKQRQDSDFLSERIPQAIEDVIAKNKPELMDDNGLPKKDAIEEVIGFSITEADYNQAMDLPTPA